VNENYSNVVKCCVYRWLMEWFLFGRATRAFQNLLYLYPDFSRCNEVHVRLGLMFKAAAEHESSLKVMHTVLHNVDFLISMRQQILRHVNDNREIGWS